MSTELAGIGKGSTFEDLHNYLKSLESPEKFIKFLQADEEGDADNEAGYRMEAVFRLFAILRLIPGKLLDYSPAYGNFNQGIRQAESTREHFVSHDGKQVTIRGNGGDASDYTAYARDDENTILATTSKSHKNVTTETVQSLDIDKIMNKFNQKQYENKKLKLCVVIRNRTAFTQMKPNKGNKDVLPLLKDAICIDWTDLTKAFVLFKEVYDNRTFESVIDDIPLEPHVARFYQDKTSTKIINCMQTAATLGVAFASALLAFLPRTGKTNVMTDVIIKDVKSRLPEEDAKYLIISPCPNETILQYFATLRCAQLRDFKIHHVSGENMYPSISNRDIYIMSKQFLQGKLDDGSILKWLHEAKLRIVFIDEAHFGCTTDLAKKILSVYAENTFRLFITATYVKPASGFNIPSKNVFTLDIEDIMLCKQIDNPTHKDRMLSKHGDDYFGNYTDEQIKDQMGNYPEISHLTHKIDDNTYAQLKVRTQGNGYGWSADAILMGNWNKKNWKDGNKLKFDNDTAVLHEMYMIFGKRDEFDMPDPAYPDDSVFWQRIKEECQETNQPIPGEPTDEPTVVVMFLPPNNVNNISNALKCLLEENHVVDNYHILITNTKESSESAKIRVDNAIIQAKNMKKAGVLVLTGVQLHLGITIKMCDVVILMNNCQGFDMVFQMIFRCMTPRKNKTNGFVIDMNLQRAITTTISQTANMVSPTKSTREAIEYLLKAKLIKLNSYQWKHTTGNASDALSKMANHVYAAYVHNSRFNIDNKIQNLTCNDIILSPEEAELIRNINNVKGTSAKKPEKHRADITNSGQELSSGVEKTAIPTETTDCDEEVNEPDVEKMNEFEFIHSMMKHIIPFMCILTNHSTANTMNSMLDIIYIEESLKTIFITIINKWWGMDKTNVNTITTHQVKELIILYDIHNMSNANVEIIANIKQMFLDSKNYPDEMSKMVDAYFQPQALEKSRYAEISTPPKHRTNLIECFPLYIWSDLNATIIEPCAGKGQLLLDVYQTCFNALATEIPDVLERKRHILEKKLYFADINPMNIFICKMLLDPGNEYNLNSSVGDTLEIDMNATFGRNRFSACLANPPYNEDPEASADPHKKPLYQNWIKYFNNICDHVVFITPSKWFTSDDKLLIHLREYMKKQSVIKLQHYSNDDEFPGVSIKGGVSYFHIDNTIKRTEEHITSFNGVDINLSSFDDIIISSPSLIPVYLHMKQYIQDDNVLSSMYVPQGRYITSEDVLSKTKRDESDIVCYVSQPKGFTNYCSPNSVNTDKKGNSPSIDGWKVVTTAAAYSGTSGFANLFIGKPGTIHSKSYISFNVNNEEEASSLESYMKCKLPHIMLSLRKITHNITNKNVLSWIPVPPLNKFWSNNDVFDYYGFTPEMRKLTMEYEIDGSFIKDTI